jgi:hypothetical protein
MQLLYCVQYPICLEYKIPLFKSSSLIKKIIITLFFNYLSVQYVCKLVSKRAAQLAAAGTSF